MASKKLQIVGGLNIPQADWNQTDETKSDFIKNKPFLNDLEEMWGTEIIFDGGIFDFNMAKLNETKLA